jgi:hypothetical protein
MMMVIIIIIIIIVFVIIIIIIIVSFSRCSSSNSSKHVNSLFDIKFVINTLFFISKKVSSDIYWYTEFIDIVYFLHYLIYLSI